MRRYIDWFLVEIEGRLNGLLGREDLHRTIQEVESHLCQQTEANLGLGMPEKEAALSAIETFGSPEKYAVGVWRESANSLFGRPADRIAGWAGIGLVLLPTVWTLWTMLIGGEPSGMAFPVLLLALLYGVATWRSRRWVLRPVAWASAGAFLITVLVLGGFTVPGGNYSLASRSEARSLLEADRRQALELAELASLIQEGGYAFREATAPEDLPPAWRLDRDPGLETAASISNTSTQQWAGQGKFAIPYGPVQMVGGSMAYSTGPVPIELGRGLGTASSWSDPGPRISLKGINDFAEAKRVWNGRADGYVRTLNNAAETSNWMATASETRLGRSHFLDGYVLRAASMAAAAGLGAAFLLNGLALLFARRRLPRGFRLVAS